jgi:hypothetical protein
MGNTVGMFRGKGAFGINDVGKKGGDFYQGIVINRLFMGSDFDFSQIIINVRRKEGKLENFTL